MKGGFDLDIAIDGKDENVSTLGYTIPTNKLCTITTVCPPTTSYTGCSISSSCNDTNCCIEA